MNGIMNIKSMDSLISSEGGLHFTAYIANGPGSLTVRSQIEEAIKVASEDIRPVLGREDRKKFLRPLVDLLSNGRILSTIKGNVGIFLSKSIFRVLHVPVPVEEYATVASSFHVKPLLRWLQEDRAFFLLTIDEKMSHFYSGTQHWIRPMDSYIRSRRDRLKSLAGLSKFWRGKSETRSQEKYVALLSWLQTRVLRNLDSSGIPLYVVANKQLKEFLSQHLPYANMRFIEKGSVRDLASVVATVRAELRREIESSTMKKIREFNTADALELTESNVHKIAKDAGKGLVKKLIVASDRKVFGKYANRSGSLALHPVDMDHEDEDVLDDIAQTVIRRGGEVFVAPLRVIPRQQPLLAISEPDDPALGAQQVREVRGPWKLLMGQPALGLQP